MCLVGLAIAQSSRFPLVVAANRDEYFDRPSAPLDWWSPAGSEEPILGGRDLRAGGTWFAVDRRGRMALVTNYREVVPIDPSAPSRGRIVSAWVAGDETEEVLAADVRDAGYAGVNVLAASFRGADGPAVSYVSNRAADARRLGPGLHGLSNATLDVPWPKVVSLKEHLDHALATRRTWESLLDALLDALANDVRAPDERLPRTGVPLEIERDLSSAFIHMPGRLYGTRCSTVLIHAPPVLHVVERSFGPDGVASGDRHVAVEGWPSSA